MPYKNGINREQITLFPEAIDDYIAGLLQVYRNKTCIDHGMLLAY